MLVYVFDLCEKPQYNWKLIFRDKFVCFLFSVAQCHAQKKRKVLVKKRKVLLKLLVTAMFSYFLI